MHINGVIGILLCQNWPKWLEAQYCGVCISTSIDVAYAGNQELDPSWKTVETIFFVCDAQYCSIRGGVWCYTTMHHIQKNVASTVFQGASEFGIPDGFPSRLRELWGSQFWFLSHFGQFWHFKMAITLLICMIAHIKFTCVFACLHVFKLTASYFSW